MCVCVSVCVCVCVCMCVSSSAHVLCGLMLFKRFAYDGVAKGEWDQYSIFDMQMLTVYVGV